MPDDGAEMRRIRRIVVNKVVERKSSVTTTTRDIGLDNDRLQLSLTEAMLSFVE